MLIILIFFHIVTIILPATGARVCETGNITLQCRVIFNNAAVPGTWSRNGKMINDDNDTLNHYIIFNSTGEGLTDLIITNVTRVDNYKIYTCSYSGGVITPDSVILRVAGMYMISVHSGNSNIAIVASSS